ncbi:MAG: hypothetical protein AABM29_10235 [Actinomycetota bacterium]
MARIVVLSPDLMLGSKVEATLRAAGHDITLSPSIGEAPIQGADLLIVDLELEKAEAVVGLGMPVLGYYPHTKSEIRQAAEAAGVDLVVPRSRMAREMTELVERLLGG